MTSIKEIYIILLLLYYLAALEPNNQTFLIELDNYTFSCPKCLRKFSDRDSCIQHGVSRKHFNKINTCIFNNNDGSFCNHCKEE